jgi:hypothetical protein
MIEKEGASAEHTFKPLSENTLPPEAYKPEGWSDAPDHYEEKITDFSQFELGAHGTIVLQGTEAEQVDGYNGVSEKSLSEGTFTGLKVISLDGYERVTVTLKNGATTEAIEYEGSQLDPTTKALIVSNQSEGIPKGRPNFKGLRAGETVSPDTLEARFGRKISLTVGMDTDGTVAIGKISKDKVPLTAFMLDGAKPAQEKNAELAARRVVGEPFVFSEETTSEAAEASASSEHLALLEEAIEDLGEEAVEAVVEEPDKETPVAFGARQELEQTPVVSAEGPQEVLNGSKGRLVDAAGERTEKMKKPVEAFSLFASRVGNIEDEAREMQRLKDAYLGRQDKGPADLIAVYTDRLNTIHGLRDSFKNIIEGADGVMAFDEQTQRLDTLLAETTTELHTLDAPYQEVVGTTDQAGMNVEDKEASAIVSAIAELSVPRVEAQEARKRVEAAYQEVIMRKLGDATDVLKTALRQAQAGQGSVEGFDTVSRLLLEVKQDLIPYRLGDMLDAPRLYLDKVSALVRRTEV